MKLSELAIDATLTLMQERAISMWGSLLASLLLVATIVVQHSQNQASQLAQVRVSRKSFALQDDLGQVFQTARSGNAVEGSFLSATRRAIADAYLQQLNRENRCKRACGSWFECDCGEEQENPWQQPDLTEEQIDAQPAYPFFPIPIDGGGGTRTHTHTNTYPYVYTYLICVLHI